MKKHLREIETSGYVLLMIGIAVALFSGYGYGMWPCAVGLLLLLVAYLYKAFHWAEYEKDNKRNLLIVLFTIVILLAQMLAAR